LTLYQDNSDILPNNLTTGFITLMILYHVAYRHHSKVGSRLSKHVGLRVFDCWRCGCM